MSKPSFPLAEATCTDKCRYKLHGKSITSAITKLGITDYQVASYIASICKNYAQVLDDEGRNAVHMAAACGRRDLLCWLIRTSKGDIHSKDQESGYTPLHRGVFYGHLNIAVSLIEMGAHLQVMDRDDLQACDHAMKDRLVKEFSLQNPCQVYVWGSNNNYTLGTGNQHSRSQPELLDYFRKNNISIKQVAIDKFHSVFVSTAGRVWVCGHGQGGRLGVESEYTVVQPQPVKTGVEVVVSASVGRDHTILLMESGMVWTCGSNTHHVLGHSPPPAALFSPRQIHPRSLKLAGGPIVGVAAARYHSVLWSETVLLTFGLNGGQLGHPLMQDKTAILPKPVTGFTLGPKGNIMDVAASVGSTVVVTNKGDVYLLNNYQIHRITVKTGRILNISKVAVFGGELNADVEPKLSVKGGEELRVMLLTSTGKLLLWQESFPQLTRCIYPLKRGLTFCRISLCLSSVLLVTKDGEAYLAHVKPKTKKKVVASKPKTDEISFNEFIEKLDCHHMSISRIPHIHRAVDITADSKGQNFVVIQEHPKVNLTDIPSVDSSEFYHHMAALLKDAHEDDALHDILIEVERGSVAAHHFVLAQSSEEFAIMPYTGSVQTVKLQGVDVHVLNQVLCFVYTHDCDVIHPGPFHSPYFKGDIIKATYDVAKRLKIPTLMKCMQSLRFEDGIIMLRDNDPYSLRQALSEQPKYERFMFPEFHDVSIASNDGATIKAHKCILAARLEYFNHMFTGGWIEADVTKNLNLSIPQTVLREVLDFLYKDESRSLADSQDVDYISSVLVVTDQLFIKRLKQICEVALCNNLSLRNAAYLLQLAITYNADQLKCCCMQFIGLNLAAVLESRILEILDKQTLKELSRYYRNMIPAMCKRIVTPYSIQSSEDDIIEIANSCPVTWFDSDELIKDDDVTLSKVNRSNPTPIPGKKKTSWNRKTSDSQRKRYESVSSNSDLDCRIDLTPTEKDFDDLVQKKEMNKAEEWTTVDKTQKTIMSRLKVIVTASTIQPTPQDFTRLVPGTIRPQHHIGSPPIPNPSLQDNRHFPELSSSAKVSYSPKSWSLEAKRSPVVKLSQKQRKKLPAEGGIKDSEPDPIPIRSPWATINNNVDCSLDDIMKNALTVNSPPKISSDQEQGQVKFADIVADEIQQRENWSKMKSKSLQLTQIEDKAMEELRVFYNAANIFDERITVERVLSANIAKPIWITSHHS